jgi:2,5-diketo-D-gluconate reductase A
VADMPLPHDAPLALNDGTTIPRIGLGTFSMTGPEGVEDLVDGLRAGYRLLDTAVNYGNEREVGEGLRRSGVPRDEVVVTSKLPGRHHAFDEAVRSVKDSLNRLGLDRIDLHLIHWPNPGIGLYGEAWRALVALREEQLVRSIGVSNFTETQLARIIEDTDVTPALNQIEVHPAFPQAAMCGVNADLGIVTGAWSPLGNDNPLLGHPVITEIATRYGRTGGQVVLRWHVQRGVVPIPRSRSAARRRENLDVFSFSLSDSEMESISALGRDDGRLFGGDPETHEDL